MIREDAIPNDVSRLKFELSTNESYVSLLPHSGIVRFLPFGLWDGTVTVLTVPLPKSCGWNLQLLSWLDFIGVIELVPIGLENLHVLVRLAVKLFADLG